VPGLHGVYVATGHSVWGMLNAPGTAEALAELITTGIASSLDLAPFSPSRMAAANPADLEMRH
jgi:glycine/D-amino acid oxidase-like deaminating enzyme